MNLIDLIILACLIPAAIMGFKEGFINKAVAIIAVIVAVMGAYHFSAAACEWVNQVSELPGAWPQVISFVILFIAIVLVIRLLGNMLTMIVKFILLGWANRLLGVLFGLAEALLVIGVTITLFDTLNTQFEWVSGPVLAESNLYGPIKELANSLFPYLKQLIFC